MQAVRSGEWKLHLPHGYRSLRGEPGKEGRPGPYIEKRTDLALYDLKNDIGESTNVADQHPEIVKKLMEYANRASEDLGNGPRVGKGVREPGRVP